MLTRVYHIIRKDLVMDMRGSYSWLSSILYLVAVVFVIYKIFGDISSPVRWGLFWVILLFSAINMTSFSFAHHTSRRKLTHYQLYDPYELISARLIINFVKLFFAGGILYGLQYVLAGETTAMPALFIKVFVLASLGIVTILTLVSSVAAYSKDRNGLVSVLSLPLLIPVLLIAMRLSLIADRVFVDSGTKDYLMILLGIDMLLVALVILFFPVIWKS